jgi:hypothetical protein
MFIEKIQRFADVICSRDAVLIIIIITKIIVTVLFDVNSVLVYSQCVDVSSVVTLPMSTQCSHTRAKFLSTVNYRESLGEHYRSMCYSPE